MSVYAPEMCISRGLARIEIWYEGKKAYPRPTGKYTRRIEDVCNSIRGQQKPIQDVLKLIAPELVKEIGL